MPRRRVVVCAAAAVAVALVACYQPTFDPCAVTCQAATGCPTGYVCGASNHCYPSGTTEPACAAPPDAAIDAAVDGAPPRPLIRALTNGNNHACAIDGDGHLLCWGANANAQAGVGSATRRLLVPTPIDGPAGPTGWTAVDGGDAHTCGIQDGALACWGDNSSGQCGGTIGGQVTSPTKPSGSGTGWLVTSTGSRFSCGIRATGPVHDLYCWGADFDGQLGDGGGDDTGAALHLANVTSEGTFTDWAEVSAGDYHACARRAGGELYCWGSNSGRLGDGTIAAKRLPTRVAAATTDGQATFATVAAGSVATCAVSAASKLYCWGLNYYGQLGTTGLVETLTPRLVGTGTDWGAVQVGPVSACGSRADGVWCWGSGGSGAIGDGTWSFRETPVHVTGISEPALVAVGYESACAAPLGGGVSCWGDNPNGELGDGTTSTKHQPTLISPSDGAWTDVAAGENHTCGIHAGVVHCWGWNPTGALGGADTEGATVPRSVAIDTATGTTTAREIGVGYNSSCALIADATDRVQPWCWGSNNHGELGIGSIGGRHPPTPIGTLGAWSSLSVSGRNAGALGGTARYVWGDPSGYGLGNGDATTPVNAPATPDAMTWQALELGNQVGCGLAATTGALSCWGSNANHLQGTGATSSPATTPQPIAAGTVFTQLSVAWSGDHACAITSGSALLCWGLNDTGQAGMDSGGAAISAPALVAGGGGWTTIALAIRHSCGIRGGGLYCWGLNDSGQLGVDGLGQTSSAATRIGAESGWTAVSAGTTHTCGVRAGNVYCWGKNVHGEIGDGSQATWVPTPVAWPAL